MIKSSSFSQKAQNLESRIQRLEQVVPRWMPEKVVDEKDVDERFQEEIRDLWHTEMGRHPSGKELQHFIQATLEWHSITAQQSEPAIQAEFEKFLRGYFSGLKIT